MVAAALVVVACNDHIAHHLENACIFQPLGVFEDGFEKLQENRVFETFFLVPVSASEVFGLSAEGGLDDAKGHLLRNLVLPKNTLLEA